MNANELRIGNIVSINNKEQHPKLIGVPLRVTSIHPSIGLNGGVTHGVCLEEVERKPNQFYGYWSQLIQFIEPIPLTEEWLLKCRFGQGFLSDPQEFNVLSAYKNGGFEILKFNDEEVFFYVDRSGNRTYIKSLHQLQNLYFALNDKELEIKL